MSFIPEIELANLQDVEAAIEEKIRYYKANYPDDRMAITDMRTALQVLYDLEGDLDADDLEEDLDRNESGIIYYYVVDFVSGYGCWGVVCEESEEKARESIRIEYEADDDEGYDEIENISIFKDEDDDLTMEIGDVIETGEG